MREEMIITTAVIVALVIMIEIIKDRNKNYKE